MYVFSMMMSLWLQALEPEEIMPHPASGSGETTTSLHARRRRRKRPAGAVSIQADSKRDVIDDNDDDGGE